MAARSPSRLSLLLLLALLITAVFPNLAAAQNGTEITDDQVNDIAKDLFCPVCESTPLDVCPTQACADWREIIRTKLSEGQTEQQIKDYFAEQYGPRALSEPPQEGFTLAVWVIPIAVVLIGGFFFSRYVQRLQTSGSDLAAEVQSQQPETPENIPAQDSYTTRIESELRERGK